MGFCSSKCISFGAGAGAGAARFRGFEIAFALYSLPAIGPGSGSGSAAAVLYVFPGLVLGVALCCFILLSIAPARVRCRALRSLLLAASACTASDNGAALATVVAARLVPAATD